MSVKPLVSLVMPTYNRARYVPTAIRCFLQQTYLNVELIIVNDGAEEIPVINDLRIVYMKLNQRTPTGTKRNLGAENARGEIIANMDDDDWSSPHRIEDEVQRLTRTGKAVTGYNATVVFDEATGLLYKNMGGPPYFASGTSQCYTKEWWKQHPFPDCSYGEDSVFARTARLADQLAVADPGHMMVARKHANNTDTVYLQRLKRLTLDDWPNEFLWAMADPRPTLDYMEQPHICTEDCRMDAERQFTASVIDYKVDSLPEVAIR
jgi:glycosyltransferase involved in cell wall biosynthesis